jgi:hypothetical protein
VSAQDNLGVQFDTSLAAGHKPRKNGTVPLYHRTYREEDARAIRDFGFKGSTVGIDRGDVYFSSHTNRKARTFGEHLITVDMPHNHPYLAHVDTWEQKGRTPEHWYALPADQIDQSWIRR